MLRLIKVELISLASILRKNLSVSFRKVGVSVWVFEIIIAVTHLNYPNKFPVKYSKSSSKNYMLKIKIAFFRKYGNKVKICLFAK